MRTVNILEGNDKILPTDWCRPLRLITANGGHSDYMSDKSEYGGWPTNNVKWVPFAAVFGELWYNVTVNEFHTEMPHKPYEFIRGEIPEEHQLDLTGYSDLRTFNKVKQP